MKENRKNYFEWKRNWPNVFFNFMGTKEFNYNPLCKIYSEIKEGPSHGS